jgi:putative transposase
MIRGYKYRLEPNNEQADKIKKTIGCARLVYNLTLENYKEQLNTYKETGEKIKINGYSVFKQDYPFLSEVDSLALANSYTNFKNAINNFFKSKKGERKGKKVSFPKKHKKSKSKLTYTTNNQNGTIDIKDGYIKLPKIGWIKLVYHRPYEGKIKSATIKQERDGTFYVSVKCEIEDKQNIIPVKTIKKIAGLDMSFTKFVVDSDDSVPDDMKPKYIRHYRVNEKRISKLQRRMSKKQLGSKNREKARIQLAKESKYVANCREDFAHKTSLYYAENYDVIIIEDIDMQKMSRSNLKGYGKSANDLGFGMFKKFLEYKLNDRGKQLVVADKWFASSKICNHCGHKNTNLKLSDRTWICPECGCVIDRDKNAAYNLRDWYIKQYNTAGTAGINACGDKTATSEVTHSQALSMKQEAATSLA